MATGRPLLLLPTAARRDNPADTAAGLIPRTEYAVLADRVGADILTFHDVDRAPLPLRLVGQKVSRLGGLALLGLTRGTKARALYLTGEDIGMPTALVHRLARRRNRLITVVHQIDTPKRRKIFARLGHTPFKAVIVLSDEQRRIFVEELKFPEHKVHRLHNWIDTEWFSPHTAGAKRPCVDSLSPNGYALAVGMESRDYPTLTEAVRGTGLRVHVVGSGWTRDDGYGAAAGVSTAENISTGTGYSMTELRDLYRYARFVIVPLNDVAYAAGVTAILEGMAMGKAIVASNSRGIRDYLRDGRLGRVVPCADAVAMRVALEEIWNDDDARDLAGRENREWADKVCNTDTYADHAAPLFD
jgi:glycosyltransferase involved in cell wall biosynthesis